MTLKNYENTWLSILPLDVQDEIESHLQTNYFSDLMTELECEICNDLPNENMLVEGNPTKYEILLESVINILIEKSNTRLLGYISMNTMSKFSDLFIMKNYRYKSLLGYNMENRGRDLYNHFTKMIVDIFQGVEKNPYKQLLMIKSRLVILTYQELMDFKKVIKNDMYYLTYIMNTD